ncbi:MAG: hypothetical protein AB1894_07955 [Chloroflexota bacterium]
MSKYSEAKHTEALSIKLRKKKIKKKMSKQNWPINESGEMKEEFDIYLRRSLKYWAARQEPLDDGRECLIQHIERFGWLEEIGGSNFSEWIATILHLKRLLMLEGREPPMTRPRHLLMLQATFRLVF